MSTDDLHVADGLCPNTLHLDDGAVYRCVRFAGSHSPNDCDFWDMTPPSPTPGNFVDDPAFEEGGAAFAEPARLQPWFEARVREIVREELDRAKADWPIQPTQPRPRGDQ